MLNKNTFHNDIGINGFVFIGYNILYQRDTAVLIAVLIDDRERSYANTIPTTIPLFYFKRTLSELGPPCRLNRFTVQYSDSTHDSQIIAVKYDNMS